MPDDFAILEPTLRDLGELRKFEKEVFGVDAWPLVDLVAMLTFPSITRLKAVINGRMAGLIASDMRRQQDLAWIITLGVLPEFRRQGIARALLLACEARITAKRIRLSVRRSNLSAIALYEAEGYRQVNVWEKYYVDREDALVLEKIKATSE